MGTPSVAVAARFTGIAAGAAIAALALSLDGGAGASGSIEGAALAAYRTIVPGLARDGPAMAAFPVSGHVMAGPTCPVERIPPDPGCADRPVEGAVLMFLDSGGREAGRAVSDSAGAFSFLLAPGTYTIQPQPVQGYFRKPFPVEVVVVDGPVEVTVTYDTGIR